MAMFEYTGCETILDCRHLLFVILVKSQPCLTMRGSVLNIIVQGVRFAIPCFLEASIWVIYDCNVCDAIVPAFVYHLFR